MSETCGVCGCLTHLFAKQKACRSFIPWNKHKNVIKKHVICFTPPQLYLVFTRHSVGRKDIKTLSALFNLASPSVSLT